MPTSKTHVITGSGAGAVVAAALHVPIMPIIIGAALGAAIPDIDSENSSISRKFLIFKNRATLQITYIIIGLAAVFNGNNALKLLGGFLILAAISGHRKFTHSLLGFLSFSGICGYAFHASNGMIKNMILGLIIGYAVHIFADSFSNHGIELFWPLFHKKFGLRIISTNKPSEHVFLVASIVLLSISFNYFVQHKGPLLWF